MTTTALKQAQKYKKALLYNESERLTFQQHAHSFLDRS